MTTLTAYERREAVLPGPAPASGYRNVLFVGATGSGKTALIRQLIGADPVTEYFPAVSTAKTTVADTEILVAPGDWYAVATFRSREVVAEAVTGCLIAAQEALVQGRRRDSARRALYEDEAQRIRLRYLFGPPPGHRAGSGDWTEDLLDRLETAGADAVELLVDELCDAILHRLLDLAAGRIQRGPDGWPLHWQGVFESRADLGAAMNLLAGNAGHDFGRLLSPVVDGIRVRGPFHPTWSPELSYLLLNDGEGLGHTVATATALSPGMVEACDRADAIVLVDNACQPLQAATTGALRQLVEAGHAGKLTLCFTHLDQLGGSNLGGRGASQDFLRSCLDQVLVGIGAGLSSETRRYLQDRLDRSVFLLGDLHRPLDCRAADDTDDTVAQLVLLVSLLRRESAALDFGGNRPCYRRSQLTAAVLAGTEAARFAVSAGAPTKASPLGRPRWRTLLAAMTGRVVAASEADRVAAEVTRHVVAAVREVAECPNGWVGDRSGPLRPVEQVDVFARAVQRRILALARKRLAEQQHPAAGERQAPVRSGKTGPPAVLPCRTMLERLLVESEGPGFGAEAAALVVATAVELGIVLTEGESSPTASLCPLDVVRRA